MDIKKHKDTIKELLDSFSKMCDYIETTDNIGCGNCPVFKECFYQDKHKGIKELIADLEIEWE